MRISIVFAVILLTLISSGASGQMPIPLGGEFQINTYTEARQALPNIVSHPLGGFLVVWSSTDEDGSGTSIHGRRLGRAGNVVGMPFQINSYTTGNQSTPSIAVDSLGDFVTVWDSNGQDGSYRSIHGQRFDPDANPLGGEFQVNTLTTGDQFNPAIAMGAGGDFIVTWNGYLAPSVSEIKAQRFDADGVPLADEFMVSERGVLLSQSGSDIALDDAGQFVVVWSAETYESGYARNVAARRFDSDGSPLGAVTLVNTFTTGDQLGANVIAEGSGDFAVFWTSEGQDGDGRSSQAQLFDAAGQRVGGELQVNTYTTLDQLGGQAVRYGEAGFFVVWSSEGQDGDGFSVQAKRLDAAGGDVGEEFQVNTYTTRNQFAGRVATDGQGSFIVVWINEGAGNFFVQGQRYVDPDVLVFIDGFESGDVAAWSSSVGAVAK